MVAPIYISYNYICILQHHQVDFRGRTLHAFARVVSLLHPTAPLQLRHQLPQRTLLPAQLRLADLLPPGRHPCLLAGRHTPQLLLID
jgi:hypothetical protein